MIRGSGIHVDDALRRFGWNGEAAAGTVIITTNAESGSVSGVRFVTRGKGPEVTFKAKDLWKNADKDATVTIKFPDLSKVSWGMEANRNQSSWMDSNELDMVVKVQDGRVLEGAEDLQEKNIGDCCVRLTLIPIAVDKLALYGGIVPLGKEELTEKVLESGMEMNSTLIPTIAMKLWFSRGIPQNGFPVVFLPSERASDKVGLGHLPLFETVGNTDPHLPEHNEVEEELCSFLRDVAPTNNVAPDRLVSMIEPDSFPSRASGHISFWWPEFRGPLTDTRGSTRNVTGL